MGALSLPNFLMAQTMGEVQAAVPMMSMAMVPQMPMAMSM